MINNVVWKPVVPYGNLYEISSDGNVKSLINNKILKQSLTTTGYKKVELYKDGKKKSRRVHRLVAVAFISNPCKFPMINHKDGNPLNNRKENLEWCDQKMNVQHAYETGLRPSNLYKYKENLIKEYTQTDISLRALAKKYGVSPKSLSKLLNKNKVRVRSIGESNNIYKIDREEMAEMFKEGKNNVEIAKHFKTNKSLIAVYRNKYKKGELL